MSPFPLLGWFRWTRKGRRICTHCRSPYVGPEDISQYLLLRIFTALFKLEAYRCDVCDRRHFRRVAPASSYRLPQDAPSGKPRMRESRISGMK